MQIFPSTIDDHRRLTSLFDSSNEQYFTYHLPDEKCVRAVLRGIPEVIPVTQINDELSSMGFEVKEIHRMYKQTKDPHSPRVSHID